MWTSARVATRRGFTLLEVLAVLLLIGIVMGVAVDFYIDLSRATRRAADSTRGVRRATAILDRVVRDLEATVLYKIPPGEDPLAYPWVFLGRSELGEGGSDHLKFVVRGREPRSTDARESDLAMVAYSVRPQEDDETRLELRRWTSPPPDHLVRDFPPVEDTQLVADGLASFSVRFLDGQGGWQEEWDSSSQLSDSGALPVAVEVALALAPDDASAAAPALTPEGEIPPLSRLAVLPLRPIDLAALLHPEAKGENGGAAQDQANGDGSGQQGEDAEGDGGRGHASADEGDSAGTLKPDDVNPECTLGNAIAQAPSQLPAEVDAIVTPAWEAFIAKHQDKPFKDYAHLFSRESVRPECLR